MRDRRLLRSWFNNIYIQHFQARILSEYNLNNSKTKYQTTSKTSSGPINRIKVNFGGKDTSHYLE